MKNNVNSTDDAAAADKENSAYNRDLMLFTLTDCLTNIVSIDIYIYIYIYL